MAKKSAIDKELKKERLVKINFKRREELREVAKNGSFDEQQQAQKKLQLTRTKSYTRLRARCNSCGRPRGTYQKFGLCRICLREAVMRGDVPGVRKASW
ncbi:MAG: 30S ribosomal protein S14 [Coxiellaceae bacterium]|nr:30S ribosomal protein S14 [Coxiellaceae bacterium]|tara:strand:- start:3544 stop:3840 length:297 start_codon:yes stop_codon:yes gene_type:complete